MIKNKNEYENFLFLARSALRERNDPDFRVNIGIPEEIVELSPEYIEELNNFCEVYAFSYSIERGCIVVKRKDLWDVISDVHACFEEFTELVNNLGYQRENCVDCFLNETPHWVHPEGRRLLLLGDLNDRGPTYVPLIKMVMDMVEDGVAHAILGNHCDKLRRYLKAKYEGYKWQGSASHGLAATIEELEKEPPEFVRKVYDFLCSLSHKFETEDLIVVHGAYKENKKEKVEREIALYGDVDRSAGYTPDGFPVRLGNWKDEYKGKKTIVFGHIVHMDERHDEEPSRARPSSERVHITENGARIIAVDWGCPFGGDLCAYRFPEHEFVSIKSKQEPRKIIR